MEEIKIVLPGDTMKEYREVKRTISNPLILLQYKRHPVSFVQEFIAYNDEEIRYYYAVYSMRITSKGVPYLVNLQHYSFAFNFSKKNFRYVNVNNIPAYVVEKINNILKVEWFTSLNKLKNYTNFPLGLMFTKSILAKVWSKTITNPEDLLKFYFKNILKIRNISWRNARDFIRESMFDLGSILLFLREADEWVENPNMFIEKIIKNKKSSSYDHLDYLIQVSSLKIRSNVAYWSDKRFIEEHNKLSDKLTELSLESKSKENLFDETYNSYLPKNIKCSFILNEYECFKEGSYMHNCIYTNYWHRIKDLSYFAISIDDEIYGRALLGVIVRRANNYFEVDQIRGIRNSDCNPKLQAIMTEWVENNQEVFKSILKDRIQQAC